MTSSQPSTSKAQQTSWSHQLVAQQLKSAGGTATSIDTADNIIIAGSFSGSVDFGSGTVSSFLSNTLDAFVAKYDGASGRNLWALHLGGSSNDFGLAVATDSANNIYVSGQFAGSADFGGSTLTSAGLNDIFLAKISSAGQVVWARRYGGSQSETGSAIAVYQSKIFLGGKFSGAVDFGGGPLTSAGGDDAFLAAFSTENGGHLWSKAKGGSGRDETWALDVDPAGNIVAGGKFSGSVNFGGSSLSSAGATDIWIAGFSGVDGAHIWSKGTGGSTDDTLAAIAVDSAGNAVATGSFVGTVSFGGAALSSSGVSGSNAIFLASLNSANGSHNWSHSYGTTWPIGDTAKGLAVNAAGQIFLTGTVIGPVDFGGGAFATSGTYDPFLVEFSSAGTHLWSRRFLNALGDDFASGVAADSAGNVAATGAFYKSLDLGAGTMTGISSGDGFVAKWLGVQPPTPTARSTATYTPPPPSTPTSTSTRTLTLTPTKTPSLTATRTPTWTPTTVPPTATRTAAATASTTPTSTPSRTASLASTPTRTPTSTPTPTLVPLEPTNTPSASSFSLSGQIRYYSNGIPVPGVLVTLAGSIRDTRVTDETGHYDFGVLDAGGTYFVTPSKFGDSAGALTSLDAVYIQQTLASPQYRTFTPDQAIAADVNGNGVVDFEDATMLLRFKVGTLSALPLTSRCLSDWLFRAQIVANTSISVSEPQTGPRSCVQGTVVIQPLQEAVIADFDAILIGDTTGNWQSATPGSATIRRSSSALLRRGFN